MQTDFPFSPSSFTPFSSSLHSLLHSILGHSSATHATLLIVLLSILTCCLYNSLCASYHSDDADACVVMGRERCVYGVICVTIMAADGDVTSYLALSTSYLRLSFFPRARVCLLGTARSVLLGCAARVGHAQPIRCVSTPHISPLALFTI